jgi:hypothetical protein
MSDLHTYPQIYPANANQGHDHDGPGPARGPYYEEPSPLTKIADVLQAHALNASHALNDEHTPAPQPLPPLAQQQQQQKSIRLRKACDSCSARKVRVGHKL